MRFKLLLLTLFHPLLLTQVASAERNLPADLQVDLIFPRNETYAPTQLFPIILSVRNLNSVVPLDLHLGVAVNSISGRPSMSRPSWMWQDVSLSSSGLAEAVRQMPSKHFFWFPAVNMTNGTADSFRVLWEVTFPRRCFANNTDPKEDDGGRGWSNSPSGFTSRSVRFSTAFRAQLPDIEATVNSCPELDEENSAAIRVTETNVEPTKCAFKSAAKELPANVSAALLDEMRCEESEWQTITAPCLRKQSTESLQSASFGMNCILLALAFALSNVL